MKYHGSRWLISLIVLFSIGSSQLFGQESPPAFDFPMEVGNKWIYLEWGFPICSGQGGFGQRCIYAKLEVVGAEELNQRKCGRFQYDTYVVDSFEMGDSGVIFKTDGVTFNSSVDIHLCQDETGFTGCMNRPTYPPISPIH